MYYMHGVLSDHMHMPLGSCLTSSLPSPLFSLLSHLSFLCSFLPNPSPPLSHSPFTPFLFPLLSPSPPPFPLFLPLYLLPLPLSFPLSSFLPPQELENVTMLQMSLKDAARTCVGARFQLKQAREGVSHGGLGLLAKHRKRERLRALLEILRTLKTLVSGRSGLVGGVGLITWGRVGCLVSANFALCLCDAWELGTVYIYF